MGYTPPTYDIHLSYDENYERGPFFLGEFPRRSINMKKPFLGFEVNSLLGIPAGPLLNSNWIRVYARLGFDLLVYKTVRTDAYPAHPNPNCLYVDVQGQLTPERFSERLIGTLEDRDRAIDEITITNSFGMPSRPPSIWQEDAERAKKSLEPGQLLIISVVGTPGKGDLIDDYARGAAMAREAGADIVEINLSCPNVVSGEGSIFSDPDYSSRLTKEVKRTLGATPLFIKMGFLRDSALLAGVVAANARNVEGICGINTLPFEVVDAGGRPALPGEGRLRAGVCGSAIRACGIEQARAIAEIRRLKKYDFVIVGVGGVMTVEDVDSYIGIGADAVMTATGAMWDPYMAYNYWLKSSAESNAGNSSER